MGLDELGEAARIQAHDGERVRGVGGGGELLQRGEIVPGLGYVFPVGGGAPGLEHGAGELLEGLHFLRELGCPGWNGPLRSKAEEAAAHFIAKLLFAEAENGVGGKHRTIRPIGREEIADGTGPVAALPSRQGRLGRGRACRRRGLLLAATGNKEDRRHDGGELEQGRLHGGRIWE